MTNGYDDDQDYNKDIGWVLELQPVYDDDDYVEDDEDYVIMTAIVMRMRRRRTMMSMTMFLCQLGSWTSWRAEEMQMLEFNATSFKLFA